MEIENRMYTAQEVAAIVNFQPQTLANWRMTDQGPPFARIGRAVRYPGSLLAAWLDANTVTPAEFVKEVSSDS